MNGHWFLVIGSWFWEGAANYQQPTTNNQQQ
jgi:hypothetical protein